MVPGPRVLVVLRHWGKKKEDKKFMACIHAVFHSHILALLCFGSEIGDFLNDLYLCVPKPQSINKVSRTTSYAILNARLWYS